MDCVVKHQKRLGLGCPFVTHTVPIVTDDDCGPFEFCADSFRKQFHEEFFEQQVNRENAMLPDVLPLGH